MSDDPSTPSGGVTLVALLYLHPDRTAEFERFEAAASRIMARYGGRIERRFQPRLETGAQSPAAVPPPDEVHVVRFPDTASFARYRADPELETLGELRTAAIRETVIWQGVDGPPFV